MEKRKPAEKPVSLRPLKVEEALWNLLKVKPVKNRGRQKRAKSPPPNARWEKI